MHTNLGVCAEMMNSQELGLKTTSGPSEEVLYVECSSLFDRGAENGGQGTKP